MDDQSKNVDRVSNVDWFVVAESCGTESTVRGPYQHGETAVAVRQEMENNDKMYDLNLKIVYRPKGQRP